MAKHSSTQSQADPEHSWHRHPLFIAVLSLAVGGFGLSWVQSRGNEKKALLDRRYSVAEDLAIYSSQAATTLRCFEIFKKTSQANRLSKTESSQMSAECQAHFNKTAEMQTRLEVNLALYFSDEKPLTAFRSLREAYLGDVNQAMTAISAGKAWAPDFIALGFRADNCICSLKGDLPIKDIGAGKCHGN